ncbi:hypothetical protein Droror1_Dr00021640 [Drosera rotundifolia]
MARFRLLALASKNSLARFNSQGSIAANFDGAESSLLVLVRRFVHRRSFGSGSRCFDRRLSHCVILSVYRSRFFHGQELLTLVNVIIIKCLEFHKMPAAKRLRRLILRPCKILKREQNMTWWSCLSHLLKLLKAAQSTCLLIQMFHVVHAMLGAIHLMRGLKPVQRVEALGG